MKYISKNLIVASLMLAGTLFAGANVLVAQLQPDGQGAQTNAQPAAAKQPPLTEKEVIHLVKKHKKDLQSISGEITDRGVDFDMTPEIQEKLTKAGATPQFIANVKNLGPTARASMAASTSGAAAATPEEMEAFQAVQNELDPDRKIQLANDYATKYPDSKLLTYVYFLAQGASLQKGDLGGIITYGEKSLAANPDNLNTLLLMTRFLPEPASLRTQVNPDERLDEAERDGQKALAIVKAMQKLPNEEDDAFTKRKSRYLEAIHSGLGMVHLQRAVEGLAGIDQEELAKSETEYRAAIAAATNPDPEDYFRLGEVLARQNKKEDAIQAFTKVTQLSQDSPAIKGYAEKQIRALKGQK